MAENLPKKNEGPSLHERLLMAVLAPIFFNFSIFIVLSCFFRRSRYVGHWLLHLSHWSAIVTLIAVIALPAFVGFALGMSKFAVLIGHLFYTNMEHEKSAVKTMAAWGALFFVAYLLSKVT